jgi:hypothetical protein
MKLVGTKRVRQLRRLIQRRIVHVDASELGELGFYQFKASTAEFFYNRLGRTAVTIKDTPHYQLATALAGKADLSKAEKFYSSYLAASWGEDRRAEFAGRLRVFADHFRAYEKGIVMPRPTLVTLAASKVPFALDGNHRLSFAAALNRSMTCERLPVDLALTMYSQAPEFFDGGMLERPKETIYLKGEVVARGRAGEVRHWIAAAPPETLEDKTVLDIGCNAGMASLLAKARGARQCVGLETSPRLVNLATRLAMFDGAYPSVSYRVDGELRTVARDAAFDTAIVRLKRGDTRSLQRNLDVVSQNIRKFVLAEVQSNAGDEFRAFAANGMFSSARAIHNGRSRKVWVLEKA